MFPAEVQPQYEKTPVLHMPHSGLLADGQALPRNCLVSRSVAVVKKTLPHCRQLQMALSMLCRS